jgi:serine/threonine-protein kinase
MEYLSGKTLKHVIREGPLPLARVGRHHATDRATRSNAAHTQGVVHRDLKSENIMLLDTMDGRSRVVLDFGIAKINESEGNVDTGLTAPNLVIGTPQ